MSARAVHLVIDARPRGPGGPLAAELVLGRSMLVHLLDLAVEVASPSEPVVVHAREEERDQLRELAGVVCGPGVVIVCGPPRADAAVLRTDRLYDAARLRRGLRRGRSPESAVLWRLDRPGSLATADEELTPALDLSAAGKILGVPAGGAAGGAAEPDRDPAQCADHRHGRI